MIEKYETVPNIRAKNNEKEEEEKKNSMEQKRIEWMCQGGGGCSKG